MTNATIVERLRAAGCVFAEEEAALIRAETDDPAEVERLVRLRIDGLPLEHVLGWAEFCGRRYAVAPGVFVPRPRTRRLVKLAVEHGGSTVLDLCCGSGAVGAAVAERLGAELVATELDPRAAAVARRNVDTVFEGDLYDALPDERRFELIVVVAPYVPTGEIALLPREARDFEPALALDGGVDGLDLVRRILAGTPARLEPGGALLTEVGARQAPVVADLARGQGLEASIRGTVVIARQPPTNR